MRNWSHLPNTLQTRISVVKMNILPRVHFISSMIPLPPPVGFWDKLHSSVSAYIWKGKKPWIKLATLQRNKTDGGLSLPNFKLYYFSFVLRPLSVWLNSNTQTSWRPLEESLVAPHRLQDLIYSNIPIKQCKLRHGPLISNLLSTCRVVEKLTKTTTVWHKCSPVFHNYKLLTANKPFFFPQWQQKGIHL